MSAPPSATTQNFSELPMGTMSHSPSFSRKASRLAPRCERLPTMRTGCAAGCATRMESAIAVCAQLGAVAFAADVGLVLNRHVHDAEHRSFACDQRNIHRKFAISIDELLGAVERVDQPVAVPLRRSSKSGQSGFLGDDRHIRRQCCQTCDDALMRGEVGLRQR